MLPKKVFLYHVRIGNHSIDCVAHYASNGRYSRNKVAQFNVLEIPLISECNKESCIYFKQDGAPTFDVLLNTVGLEFRQ